MIVADAGEEGASLEQVREHSSELLASGTDSILITVADAVGERTSFEQAREHSSRLLGTMHGYLTDYRR